MRFGVAVCILRSRCALLNLLLLTIFVQTASAAPLACHAKSAQSQESAQSVAMRVVNASNVPALIAWIDFEGRQDLRFLLQSGKSETQNTFATHPWIAISTTGDCMCGHIAEADAQGRDEWVIDPFEPTANYSKRLLSSFATNVSARLVADTTVHGKSTAHVEHMLSDMAAKLPQPVVVALRKTTPVWVELSDCRSPAGTYHPSIDWLADNGVNPDKAKGVQVTADHLYYSEQQPAMMLHEFAHAFHDRFLRFDNAEVLKAYAQACRSRKYESVSHVNGKKVRAYALVNQMEFFAELSEAYFWRNDMEPFDRDGLAEFDPASMRVVERLWRTALGKPNTGDTGAPMTCAEGNFGDSALNDRVARDSERGPMFFSTMTKPWSEPLN